MYRNRSRLGRLAVSLAAAAAAAALAAAVVVVPQAPAAAIVLPFDATQGVTPAVDDEFGDYIFSHGRDSTLLYAGARGSSISDLPPFVSLGGVVPGDPAAVTTALGPRAFVRGQDGQVYTILVRDFTTSTGFQVVPGVQATSDVTAVAVPRPDGSDVDVRLFVRNQNDGLSTNLLTAGGWTGWTTISEIPVTSQITAELGNFSGLPGPSIRIVFRTQQLQSLRTLRTALMRLDGTMTPFVQFGPNQTIGNLSLVPETDEVFTRGFNNSIVSFNFATGTLTDLGGVGTSNPSASALADGSVEVVVKGQDNALYVNRRFPGGGFSGYTRLGGVATGNPVSPGLGLQLNDVVVNGRDGVLFSNPQAFDGSFLGYRAFAGARHPG